MERIRKNENLKERRGRNEKRSCIIYEQKERRRSLKEIKEARLS